MDIRGFPTCPRVCSHLPSPTCQAHLPKRFGTATCQASSSTQNLASGICSALRTPARARAGDSAAQHSRGAAGRGQPAPEIPRSVTQAVVWRASRDTAQHSRGAAGRGRPAPEIPRLVTGGGEGVFCTRQHNRIRCDAVEYNTIRYETIRYDTVRYDTVR